MANDHIETVGTAHYDSREKLRRLPRNAEALTAETQRLKDLRDDLRSRAENQARQTNWVISNQLSGWMTNVEILGVRAEEFKTSFENPLSSRHVTRYNLAETVVDLLREVVELIDQGNLLSDRNLLLQPQQPDTAQQVSSATLVGAKEPLQQIKDSTRSEEVCQEMDSDVVVKVDARRSWKERLTKVWDRASGSVASLILLSRNAEELGEEMAKLKELRDDLNDNRLQPAHQLRDTGQVENQLLGWMNRVDGATLDVASFQRLFEGHSYISRFGLGSTAGELLIRVRRLASEGNRLFRDQLRSLESSEDDIESLGRQVEAVASVPSDTSSSSLVGATERLQEIKQYIQDDRVGVIGIYGMGGTGKTALLKIINNEFLMEEARRSKFDVAIWVTVSREPIDIASIQKIVASRLGLPSDAQAKVLFQDLSEKRFILLLDDVWETPDLLEIGIPIPKTLKTRSKILFTTRSEELCGQMGADVLVKVGPLDQHSSWELFCSAFGRYASIHVLDKVGDLAKKAVAKCGGLPISLITVGSAMAQAETTDDWQDAITKLRHRPAEFSEGMRKDVLRSLKYSFEVLRSKALQDCLLYFSLFPEDTYIIEKNQIVNYWICEGFLNFKDFIELDIEDTRRRARKMITELQNACLLEVDDERPQHLRLHDTVRDMALWITKEEFVVLAGFDCNASHVPKLAIWKKATRISLIDNKEVEEPPSSCWDLNCPNLTTLLLQNSRLGYNVARNQGFLTCSNMPALRVLDLSKVYLEELPIGITSLISLQFLSLRRNRLTSLPVELGKLVNLRQLDLSGNNKLQPIPREALSRLSSLQVLNMRSWFSDAFLQRSELYDLKSLKSLCELHLRGNGTCSWELLQKIAESPALRRSMRELELTEILLSDGNKDDTDDQTVGYFFPKLQKMELDNLPSLRSISTRTLLWPSLENLIVNGCPELGQLPWNGGLPCFPKLRILQITNCGCSDLTLTGPLPCLESLKVEDCKELTEILLSVGNKDDQTVGSFFPKLQKMELANLWWLRSISTRTLLWPSLEKFIVSRCPHLRELPWNSGLPCFPKLRILQITDCGYSDLTLTAPLPCLESLKVDDCKELTEILLSVGNKDDQTVGSFFPKLQKMELANLPSLRSICTHTLLLSSLEVVIVNECPNLRQLPWNSGLPCSPKLRILQITDCGYSDLMWTRTLPSLESFKVEDCKELTEILLSDGNKDDIDDQTVGSFFPKLQKMELANLPSLRSISTHTLLLSSLEEFIVSRCPHLRELPWNSGLPCSPKLRILQITDCGYSYLMLTGPLPSLESLKVEDCKELTEIVLSDGNKDNTEDQTVGSFFPKLQKMELANLWWLRSISTHTLLWPSLEKFIVRRCPHLRELPWNSGLPCSPKLRILQITDCGYSYLMLTGPLPSLESLKVEDCKELTEIVLSDGNKDNTEDQTVGSFFPKLQKMELANLWWLRSISTHTLLWPSLEKFIVRRCPHLRELPWNSGLPCSPKLRILQITDCGYSDLMLTGPLPSLESLKVEDCKELTEIVLSDGNKDDTDDQTVGSFPKLQKMELDNLRSLRSISTHTLLLFSLEELIVNECPELGQLPWNGGLSCFPILTYLQITSCGCSDLTLTGPLPCLEQLVVKNCKELTQIVLSDGNKYNTDDQTGVSFFPKLQKMELDNLPSLRSISTRTLLWPSLEKLIVNECPELGQLPWNGRLSCFPILTYLKITSCDCSDLTLTGPLPCLEQLVVKNCKELTEIALSDGNKDDTDDQTGVSFLPKLQKMELDNLRSLRSISTRTLLWPSLEKLIVNECPELGQLPWNGGFSCFPILTYLQITSCGCSDLTLTGPLPCLEQLVVKNCKELTEILLSDGNKDDTDDQTVGSFPKLQKMELDNLRSLRSISTHTLLLSSLEEVIVIRCPNLRQLPWNGGLPCFPKLTILQITNCGCSDLTWIGRLPSLESLKVEDCKELTKIVLSDGNKDDTDDQTVGSFFPKLQKMKLANLPSSTSITLLLLPSLEELIVKECPKLRQLLWNGRLPCLKQLVVEKCGELREILLSNGNKDDTDDQTVGSFFPKLQKMELANLRSLRSISKHTLLWPSLEELIVHACSELKRLPFSGDSAPNIRRIKGSKAWWNRLEWEEITIKERFGSKFEDSVW